MESEIEQSYISSPYFDKKKFQKQLDIIKQASELAQKKIDYFSAHDDNVVRAVEVVEDFLRKKHRLCYGGQAINAHLPAKYKFYDPEYSIPDYDFFTPQQNQDIQVLVKDLRKAGFTEISAREGMHEGTVKIYVDYVPVADMTAIDAKLYRILSKREFRTDGISYLDANTLRMLMYLELSRPRGEVGRWPKVFERLALFNEFVPVRPCHIDRGAFHGFMTKEQTEFTLNFIVENKRVFAGGDLLQFYRRALKGKKGDNAWILSSKKPILFYSSDVDADAKLIQAEFQFLKTDEGGAFSIKSVSNRGVEMLPSMKIITQGKKSLVFIVDQTACHSYFNVPMDSNKILRIASMDTLITLYFSLGLVDSKYFDMGSMECLANELVQVSIRARKSSDTFAFPFISIKCVGHQTSLPSLIRAKVQRITQKKQGLKQLMNAEAKRRSNNTIRHSQNRKNGDRKNGNRKNRQNMMLLDL